MGDFHKVAADPRRAPCGVRDGAGPCPRVSGRDPQPVRMPQEGPSLHRPPHPLPPAGPGPRGRPAVRGQVRTARWEPGVGDGAVQSGWRGRDRTLFPEGDPQAPGAGSQVGGC